jgi:hypothetical protein
MSFPIDPFVIETRKRAIETSYHRQLELAGRPGYDPKLTLQLKKDLDWLKEQELTLEDSNNNDI